MLKFHITEHDSDYHGAVCGSLEKEFETLEDAEQWCRDNRNKPFSYSIDFATNIETNEIVYRNY